MNRKNTNSSPLCETYFVNEKNVRFVKKNMQPDSTMQRLAETFKMLGDPARLKIILALSKKELCVCDISTLFAMSQSAVSHQLRILRNLDVVKYRKDGKIAYYSLQDTNLEKLFSDGLKLVEEK